MIPRSTKTAWLLPLMLVLLLLQVACEVGQSHSASYNDLLLQVVSSRSRAEVGQPIYIRFSITNTGINRHTYLLESPTTPVMDIVILGRDDQVLASWSARNPEQVSHRLEWKPGESKTIDLVWVPTQADYEAGEYYLPRGVPRVYVSGRLYINSKLVKGAGFELCFKTRC